MAARDADQDKGDDPPQAGLPAPRSRAGLPARRLRPMALMPGRRGPVTRLAVLAFDVFVLCVLGVAIAMFSLSGREVAAPGWLTQQISESLDAGLPEAALQIGSVSMRFDTMSPPQISFHDVRLRPPGDGTAGEGPDIVKVPRVDIGLRRRALLSGRVQPDALRLSGTQVVLQRDATGRFDLGFGGGVRIAAPTSLPDLLDRVDRAFAQPALAPIRRIAADDITLTLIDGRAGRTWSLQEGRITLTQTDAELRIASAFRVPVAEPSAPGAEQVVPEAEVIFTVARDTAEGSLAARLDSLPAEDIAAQSDGLTWLAPLQAPVSGALRASLRPDGSIGAASGKLEVASGTLAANDRRAAVPFDAAVAYFSYDPADGRVAFDEIALRGPMFDFTGNGHAYLSFDEAAARAALPTGLVAQIRASRLRLEPDGVFADAARFADAAADLRIGFRPFTVEIGQVALGIATGDGGAASDAEQTGTEDGRAASAPSARIIGAGNIAATPEGWQVALDADIDAITVPQVLALWPLALAPRTRDWLLENLGAGQLTDARAAFRAAPGAPLRRQVNWRFSDATFTPLPGFPQINGAAGFGSLSGDGFSLTLEQGRLAAPGHGPVDLAGSVFQLPEPGVQPPPARLSLVADGPLRDVLAVLDRPPLRLFRARPGGVAGLVQAGQAALRATLDWRLGEGVTLPDMALQAEARLSDLRAETLVPGKVLRAERLTLRADSERVTIAGRADLSGLPVDAIWSRALGPEATGATVEGSLDLSDDSLRALGVVLPKGTVSGAGRAEFTLSLPGGGAAPGFTLVSDLNRVALSLPEIGWSKPAAETGVLRVSGSLGPPLAVPELRLEAPGLAARAAVRFGDDGAFTALDIDRLQVGGWLDAPVTLAGRGPGRPPAITVRGGRVDLAGLPRGGGGGAGQGQGGGLRLQGTRVAISDRVALTDVTGEFAGLGAGARGNFTARVNGAAGLRGTLAPSSRGTGTALRLTAEDAGGALRAAGLFDRAQGGDLTLVMQPRQGRPGYDGTLSVTDTRVTSASGLATLLNAISIVGLLDQLSGPGILFSAIDADFTLTPRVLEVRNGAGVGPSLGLTMQGIYDLSADRLDMQGVLSPVYVLNGIGQIFSRRGEGVFGFNYTMTGAARAPQVSVNPLSVLTPGLFRELFRRAPPRITQ